MERPRGHPKGATGPIALDLFASQAVQSARPSHGMLAVALALWVPLLLAIGAIILQTWTSHRAGAEARLRETTHNVAIAVDAALRTQIAALTALARSLPRDAPVDPGAFAQRAALVGEALGGVLLFYGPPPGDELLATTSSDPAGLRAGIAAGALVEATTAMVERIRRTGQPSVSNLFTSPVRPRPLVSVGVAVPGLPAASSPRLHLAFEPIAIQTLLASLEIPPEMRVTIRDRAFRVVASSDPTREPGPAVNFRWVPERLGEAQKDFLAGPDGAGTESLVAVERLATDPGWLVMVTQPVRAASSVQTSEILWLMAGGALAVSGIVAVIWAARWDQRRRAAEELAWLRAAQAQVARLHDGLPAVLVLREIDAHGGSGRMLYRAGDTEAVLGWPADRLGEDALGDLAELPGDLRRFRADVVRQGAAKVDLRIRQPDGGWRWVRLRTQRLAALPDGGALSVGYVVDISSERTAQVQAQASARLASMTDMAHGLSHELKQPLQTAMLQADTASIHAQRLHDQAGGPLAQAASLAALEVALKGCIDQIARAGRLIEYLRRFARGPVEGAPPEPVGLSEVVEETLVMLGRGLEGAGIRLDCDLGDPPPVVKGQRIGIEQILINLLNNARDALVQRPPGEPRRIAISAEPATDGSGAVLVHVSDSAGGIPEHILDRIFEPLVTTKGIEEGTGLGLAISRTLAREMGGEIEVRNGAEGAVFTLRLLAAPTPPATAMAAE